MSTASNAQEPIQQPLAFTHQPTIIADDQKLVVYESLRLVDAHAPLTKNEYKLLMLCIARINPLGDYSEAPPCIRLTVKQISTFTGIKSSNVYRLAADAAKHFQSVPIETPGKKPGTVDYINIAHRSRFDPGIGIFQIEFHQLMTEELVNLARYVHFEAENVMNLSSKYSATIYLHLLKALQNKNGYNTIYLSVDKLRFSIGVVDSDGNVKKKSIAPFNEFYRRVLYRSLTEIDEMTDISLKKDDKGNFVISKHRTGRRCSHIVLEAQRTKLRSKAKLSIDAELESLGFPLQVSKKMAADFNHVLLRNNLDYYYSCVNSGMKINSPASFFNYLLKYNIAGLPNVANPYAERYRNNDLAKTFVRNLLLPIWHQLDHNTKETIAAEGLIFGTKDGVSLMYELFIQSCKQDTVDNVLLEINIDVMTAIYVKKTLSYESFRAGEVPVLYASDYD